MSRYPVAAGASGFASSHNVVPMRAEDRFEEFWRLFPKRVGKPIAKAKWDAITNGGLETRTLDKDSGTYITLSLRATPEEIIEGLKRCLCRWHKPKLCVWDNRRFPSWEDDGKFLPMPSTWLNQGRWQDE